MKSDTIISLKEARRILGREARGMSDEAVLDLVKQYDAIAGKLVKTAKVLKSSDLSIYK